MTNLDSILKSRDITFANKGPHNQNYDFSPVVMYGCENCTIKKAEHRIDAFELWCWRRLESPVDCKEIKPVHPKGDQSWEYSLEGLMLKLKLQYFARLMRRADSLDKTLMLGKIGGRRIRE